MIKKIIWITFILTILLNSCKNETKKVVKELTILEKIANANGYNNWKNINKIDFTFNVDKDTSHFERRWVWNIKSNTITNITAKDTITYKRSKLDSITTKTNAGFINDKFWLLAPYNLVWDASNFTYEHTLNTVSPINKQQLQKLTIVYSSVGGYTPGDAYDFYFNDDYIIQEWVFRKANQEKPSMINTWEAYKEIKGLKIATMHKNKAGNFKLYFTNLKVE